MQKYLKTHAICTAYFIFSSLTSVLNKIICVKLSFQWHNLLIALQSAIITTLVLIYGQGTSIEISAKRCKKWSVAALLLSLMMLSNVKCLFYLPLTVFTLFKNISVILLALLEIRYFDKKVGILGFTSFALMVGSSYTGKMFDSFSLYGYYWMAINTAATTLYVFYLKHKMSDASSNVHESVFYTNLIAIPFIGALSIAGDPKYEFGGLSKLVLPLIFISSASALCTSLFTALILKVLSGTTLSMMGAINKVILSISGVFVFREQFSPLKILSVAIGILAGILYSLDGALCLYGIENPNAEPGAP
ncbi:GDP-mannose transporter [Enteropsectra breve]|nr:GDP-mannose transporter [Enteropsectra breve]